MLLCSHAPAYYRVWDALADWLAQPCDGEDGEAAAGVRCSAEEGDCGPSLGMPNYPCPDGSVGGPTGRCELEADGASCSWTIAECAADA